MTWNPPIEWPEEIPRMPKNEQWRLAARPQGLFKESDFRWVEEETPPLADGQALVRTIYLSLDPTNRGWAAGDTYLPAVPLDTVMRGIALGRVEESRTPGLAPGDVVQGMLGWQRYAVLPAAALTKLPPIPLPLSAHFGLLGHIGLTAWVGLLQIGQPKEGETLVVSAAAGAVGSLVGQIGKIHGMRVVGIAGSDEKCRWLTGDLGFDAAVNYKKRPVLAGLRRECPGGIDVYFDNVGGETLDAVLSLINRRARIVICGLISQYNATAPAPGPRNLGSLLVQRARMEGFIVLDHLAEAERAAADLVRWHLAGRLRYRLDVVPGLDQAPAAVNRLFDGTNAGKLVVKVSEE
jgi:NADPH-dependent curcumin reductase